jgi:hypothetical protein
MMKQGRRVFREFRLAVKNEKLEREK